MNLDVLIPSLLLPSPLQQLIPPPQVPALERMLARADRRAESAADGSAWLCERWGVHSPLPLAALLAEHDGLDVGCDGWLFAEPVHMLADRDAVKLHSGRSLDLNDAETAALVMALNAHFSRDGITFFAPEPDRWYVRCSPSEVPVTRSLALAQRGSLADHQPGSGGKLNWRALQNEAQMLLFTHPVNQARETSGKTTVNGVWFWGGGVMPNLIPPRYDHVFADAPLAMQLAKKSGVDLQSPAPAALLSLQGNSLLVLDACAKCIDATDLASWSRELEKIDREWFLPLSNALAGGKINQLNIYAPDGDKTPSFQLTRGQLRLRFWRGKSPLGSYA